MNIELGIALLPNINIDKLVYPVKSKQSNIYHVSLYQFCADDSQTNLIATEILSIIKEFREISADFDQAAKLVENNIFWNAHNNPTLLRLHERILQSNIAKPPPREYLLQIKHALQKKADLSTQQHDLIRQYGIWWVKQLFNPHITLEYDTIINQFELIKFPKNVTFDTIVIGELGYHGNLHRIVWETKL